MTDSHSPASKKTIMVIDDNPDHVNILRYGDERIPRLWVGNILLDQSELRIFSEDRKRRTTLSIPPDGSASLELYDKEGNKRAVLGSISLESSRTETVTKIAESSLVLFDKEGKVIFNAP
jgi:hypothetical protein